MLNSIKKGRGNKNVRAAQPQNSLKALNISQIKKRKNSKKENAVTIATTRTNMRRKENGNIISFVLTGRELDFAQKTQKIKCKICQHIFQAFKKHENYKNFKKFAKIEKSLFSNSYEKLSKMAAEIRQVFNEYFTSLAIDAVNYPKIFCLFSHFENIYKDFECKKFINESKNILEIKKKMYKLQKIVKFNKNAVAGTFNAATNSASGQQHRAIRLGGEIESFYNYESNREKRISNKFKLELLNNIKGLNTEQIRGMLRVLQDSSSNGLDAQSTTTVELNINKLSAFKIKELDKYVRRCILETKNKELKNFSFSSSGYNANKNLHFNSEFTNNHNNEKRCEVKAACTDKSDNCLLGKKHTRNFFDVSEDKNFNNNTYNYNDSELYYVEENNKNNNFYSNSNKICISNNISISSLHMQNSFTKAETPKSNMNKSKFERGNSLDIESDNDSDESSDEESYSDLEIGHFRI